MRAYYKSLEELYSLKFEAILFLLKHTPALKHMEITPTDVETIYLN